MAALSKPMPQHHTDSLCSDGVPAVASWFGVRLFGSEPEWRLRVDRIILAVGAAVLILPVADGADDLTGAALRILERHCLRCHNDVDHKGGLTLETRQAVRDAGIVTPGDAQDSSLLVAVSPAAGEPPAMPKDSEPLTNDERNLLRLWIDGGAPWPDDYRLQQPSADNFGWWSLEPLRRPTVPRFDENSDENKWIRNPIDAFIAARHLEHGLTHSSEADQRTLIRRLTFDLTGLPPSPEETEQFVSDQDPQAWEKRVDRLLASERYGERWARHWLDVVKYADTCGYDKDKLRPHAWPYRDYVIESFNADKPYSRFVQEQIAGDVLFPDTQDGIRALGFIAAGPWDFIGHAEVSEQKIDGKIARHLDRDDMVANTLNTFCSVTIQCARCHNHKFDPFTQEHYYSLQSVFAAVDKADRPFDLSVETVEIRRELTNRLNTVESAIKAHDKELSTADDEVRVIAEAEVAKLQSAIDDLKRQLEAVPAGTMVYAAATHFEKRSQFRPTEGQPRTIRILHRGNITLPLQEVSPGVIPLSAADEWRLPLDDDHREGDRRAALAGWLTDTHNPLVWRSVVNRIWQYHFGQAIVSTPNDFGRMGQLPGHPQLLDWLAVEFRDSGQSFKHLHRLILSSAVWKQSSVHDPHSAAVDSSNRFLWRHSRRRLSAEELRDSILHASGRLNLKMGGPAFYLFALEKTSHSPHYEYHKFDPADRTSHRRSIYRFIVRSQPDPFMTTLDCADSSQSTPRRTETFTPLQALSLMNNRFTLFMAQAFSERLLRESADWAESVNLAFALCTGRTPTESERQEMMGYAAEHGMPALCRLMFNLSEFMFID